MPVMEHKASLGPVRLALCRDVLPVMSVTCSVLQRMLCRDISYDTLGNPVHHTNEVLSLRLLLQLNVAVAGTGSTDWYRQIDIQTDR